MIEPWSNTAQWSALIAKDNRTPAVGLDKISIPPDNLEDRKA